MYVKLNDKQLELFKKIYNLTGDDYCIEYGDNLIEIQELLNALNDMYHKYDALKEKFDDYQEHVKECYRQKTPYEMEMEDI